MKFIKKDYFKIDFKQKFDGVITDIPYKNAIKNKLNEQNFSFKKFMEKTDLDTIKNSFLITFTNFRCIQDLITNSVGTNWKLHTYMIWDKRPTRTWISWTYPLRSVEFIVFFKKGKFKFSFKDGTVKEPYKRNSFGGSMKNIKKRENKVSYGMYHEIISLKNPRKRIHPTQKPVEFSKIFYNIVGGGENLNILDPFCGSGNLLHSFNNSTGIDIKNYNKNTLVINNAKMSKM